MNVTRLSADSLREAMRKLVPPTGAALTPQLAYRIKRETLALMKARGCDLTAHARKVRLEFMAPDKPNLIIPVHLIHPTAH
ncbi:MAG: hypothetical protein B7Z62_08905 [Deltaproteobacteria bacterium 37-65-8]|nr:MAG: hypothetical protein B7Z62_08905 [Deltaproteobacteria bacterium 37-65-8]